MTTAAVVIGLVLIGSPIWLIGIVATACLFAELMNPYK